MAPFRAISYFPQRTICGPSSSVSIATSRGLKGPGTESRWGRDIPYLSRRTLGSTQPPVNGYWVFSGGKERPGCDTDPSPPPSAVGRERVEIHFYFPYGPYGLYRASVSVQGCTLPLPYGRAIPLLPLRAVRPIQSLSACTRVHFTFTLQ
jgi:hypothetical protein